MEQEATSSLRVILVGAGMVADIHRKGLARIANARIVGIADLDARAAAALAERVPDGARASSSLAELLREEEADVVHVLTPPASHPELVEQALGAGAHVYVEKPMAETESACHSMADAARAAGRLLCVGHCMVHDPLMDQVREWLRAGRLGELRDVRAVYAFDPSRIPNYGRAEHWYNALPGGFLEDLMAHPASLLVDLLDGPALVGVTGATPGSGDVTALVEDRQGVSGTMHVSLRSRPEDVSLELRGTQAMARISFSHFVATLEMERSVPRALARGLKNLELAARLTTGTLGSTVRHALGRLDTTKGIHSLLGRFYSAIQAGGPAPVPVYQGGEVVRLIRGIWPGPERTS